MRGGWLWRQTELELLDKEAELSGVPGWRCNASAATPAPSVVGRWTSIIWTAANFLQSAARGQPWRQGMQPTLERDLER